VIGKKKEGKRRRRKIEMKVKRKLVSQNNPQKPPDKEEMESDFSTQFFPRY